MPNYTFKCNDTGRTWTESMSNSDREVFLEANPNIQQILKPIATLDPYSVGGPKKDSEWRDLLGRIKKNNRGSNIDSGNLTAI